MVTLSPPPFHVKSELLFVFDALICWCLLSLTCIWLMMYGSCTMYYKLFLYQKVQNVTCCIFSAELSLTFVMENSNLHFQLKKYTTVFKSIIRLAPGMAEKARNVIWLQKKCRQIFKSKCYIAFLHLNFKQIRKTIWSQTKDNLKNLPSSKLWVFT